jgi:hypothetical protein
MVAVGVELVETQFQPGEEEYYDTSANPYAQPSDFNDRQQWVVNEVAKGDAER